MIALVDQDRYSKKEIGERPSGDTHADSINAFTQHKLITTYILKIVMLLNE